MKVCKDAVHISANGGVRGDRGMLGPHHVCDVIEVIGDGIQVRWCPRACPTDRSPTANSNHAAPSCACFYLLIIDVSWVIGTSLGVAV